MSWIPASLKKLQLKLKSLRAGQHFPHYKSMGNIFVAQGLVTLQKIIRPGPNANWLEILCLSWIPASLRKLQLKLKPLWAGQHFPHYKSMGNILVAQGLVPLQKIIRPGPNSNWSEILCLSWIPASLKKLQSKLKSLWAGQHFPHYKSMGKPFVTQGLVPLQKKIIQPSPNSNQSEILCLFWISASLNKL